MMVMRRMLNALVIESGVTIEVFEAALKTASNRENVNMSPPITDKIIEVMNRTTVMIAFLECFGPKL